MLITYILGSLALIAKPGPDLMCLIATAIADGKRSASALMAGQILGCWLWILLLAAGFAPLFAGSQAVMVSVQAVGVVYIGYLAVGAFREAVEGFRHARAETLRPMALRGWRIFGRGVAMAMSNPLTILFFLAFLPHFTRADSALPARAQTLMLGTVFCLLIPLFDVPLILAAGFLRDRFFSSPRAMASLKLVSAIILALVAIILLAKSVCFLRQNMV
jgi:threonine/homoserine/homoserine lactone efflux protein